MSTNFVINARSREDTGKGASRRLRRQSGEVPAIIYGGKKHAEKISILHKDITKALEEPLLIVVGLIWMAFHVGLLFAVAKLIKAPFFFLAVGSKANVGGAASAPVVASAFHPSLAPVGVLLAVLGYALGTYGAIICATLMEMASP